MEKSDLKFWKKIFLASTKAGESYSNAKTQADLGCQSLETFRSKYNLTDKQKNTSKVTNLVDTMEGLPQ
jgi:hypothetical protein